MATGFSYQVVHQADDTILLADATASSVVPSIEDSAECMSEAIDQLVQNRGVTKIIYSQKQDYEYPYEQTQLLAELARTYRVLIRERKITHEMLAVEGIPEKTASQRYTFVQQQLHDKLKRDPLGAYVAIKREHRKAIINRDKSLTKEEEAGWKAYLQSLSAIITALEKTQIVQKTKERLEGLAIGDRAVYRKVFFPSIKPDFMFTKVLTAYPKGAQEIDSYSVGESEVAIFKLPDNVQLLYHLTPPEFKLPEEEYDLLDTARKILAEHKPTEDDFVDPERMREVFANVGRDLLEEIAIKRDIDLTEEQLEKLTQILIRYTVGFGLVEVLLEDPHIQDVTVNSPTGKSPIYLVHGKYEDCVTNIVPTVPEVESWASKLRMISGRPLDEANPILDADIIIPEVAAARVGAIGKPLEPTGLAFAFRRHRDKPWTFPLFIKNGMLSPLAAGLLSFLIDGNRTFLVAGTRSAGKSSLLGSVMVEIMRKYRMITIEDTLELPGPQLQELGYNLQRLKVASALSKNSSEVPADEGIRTTLRLGDSCLIVGEVRSTEAQALYEAMRVGALANVVAGTIHGDSPYGVFDRVVNDLKVPRTSFKATDIIVVANPVRSADGLHRTRRVTEIAEVRKHWEDDPLQEGGFVTLMAYDPLTDKLEPTDALINGESEIIKNIAGRVKEWAGNWNAVWSEIQLRAEIKAAIVRAAEEEQDESILEAPFVIAANDAYHRIAADVRAKDKDDEYEVIKREFTIWLQRACHQLRHAPRASPKAA
jgi:archaeal flagellar protein FlaI